MVKWILLLVLICGCTSVFSCDCIWHGSFLDNRNQSDVVLIGKVIGYDQFSIIKNEDTSFYYPSVMIIEIQEIVLKNDSVFNVYDHLKEERRVKVLGNISSNCRPNVDSFEINSIWFFKLNKANTNNYYGINFVISNCATTFLKIENGLVSGNVEGDNQKTLQDGKDITMDVDTLKKKIMEINCKVLLKN